MDQYVNDIAIILTQKIIGDLTYNIVESQCDIPADKIPKTPSYFMVREQILNTLTEYIKVFYVETKFSPQMISDMGGKLSDDYFNREKEKRVFKITDSILRSDLIYTRSYKTDYYASDTDYIGVLNMKKINKAGKTK